MAQHYFVAITVSEYLKKKLEAWVNENNPSFKTFVHKEDYHITLVFLGALEKKAFS